MKKQTMTEPHPDPLTPEQRAEVEALAALPEDQINTRDIPEQRDWSCAQRGALHECLSRRARLKRAPIA